MKVTVLLENTAHDPQLIAEHGLSLWIETGHRRILFDCGQSDAFAHNADRLHIDLASADTAVLSHGHYDHGGGLPFFFQRNSTAAVMITPTAFEPHFNGTEKDIGLAPALRASGRFTVADGNTPLGDGITLIGAVGCPARLPIEPYGLTVKREDGCHPDDFTHEQCLMIEENGHRILISGCSHRGVLNWLDTWQPDIFIGGFHFMKLDPDADGRDTLLHAADRLNQLPCRYYTGHCTGAAAYDFLKQRLGDRLQPLYTGASYSF